MLPGHPSRSTSSSIFSRLPSCHGASRRAGILPEPFARRERLVKADSTVRDCPIFLAPKAAAPFPSRSEEHTSELQSLMRISYAVFCLKKKNRTKKQDTKDLTTHIQCRQLRQWRLLVYYSD